MTGWERVDQAINSGLGFIVAGALAGIWWVARTFFTDRARITILEREVVNLKHDLDKIDGKLDSIQEALRK